MHAAVACKTSVKACELLLLLERAHDRLEGLSRAAQARVTSQRRTDRRRVEHRKSVPHWGAEATTGRAPWRGAAMPAVRRRNRCQ
jgi:hypothetical protein